MKNLNTLRYFVILSIIFIGIPAIFNAQELSENKVCVFEIGQGSAHAGTYAVVANEGDAFAYDDFENKQFLIEMHGENDIHIMIILEKLSEGKHPFTMEMQVAIDISKDGGESSIGFSNRYEEQDGFIQIDKIDKKNGIIGGSFSGLFTDDSSDATVNLKGKFIVKME